MGRRTPPSSRPQRRAAADHHPAHAPLANKYSRSIVAHGPRRTAYRRQIRNSARIEHGAATISARPWPALSTPVAATCSSFEQRPAAVSSSDLQQLRA
eukprot:10798297-Alexandrium_andersonii.AAC.1